MGRKDDWMRRISEQMQLPMEPLPGVPLVEVAGDDRVLIENHKGIVRYSSEKICAKVKFGLVSVCGQRLELAHMSGEKLIIRGKIDSVTLYRGGKQ